MFPWVWLVGVTVWDSGWYYCELENDIDNPVTLKHNLQVTGTYISNIIYRLQEDLIYLKLLKRLFNLVAPPVFRPKYKINFI